MSTATKKIDVYKVTIENLKGDFRMDTHMSRIDKESFLSTIRYSDIIIVRFFLFSVFVLLRIDIFKLLYQQTIS